jgi:uncharacterized membrane protein YphA (DoxX/SURF4 family)
VAGKLIVLAMRLALAWTFLQAGALKIWDFDHARSAAPDFVVAIQQFKLLPSPDLAVIIAIYLPWMEIFAGLGLFIRRVQLGAGTVISGMTLVFMAALASAMARGLRIECGCFGRDQASTDIPALLVRDAFILGAALFLLYWDSRARPERDRSMFGDSARFTLP